MIFSLKPPFSWEGGWMLCGTSVSKAECWLRDWAIAATPRQLKWVWQWPLKMHSTTDMALSYSWLRHIHKYRLMFTLYSKESHPYHSKISPNSHKHWRLGFCPLEATPSGKKTLVLLYVLGHKNHQQTQRILTNYYSRDHRFGTAGLK